MSTGSAPDRLAPGGILPLGGKTAVHRPAPRIQGLSRLGVDGQPRWRGRAPAVRRQPSCCRKLKWMLADRQIRCAHGCGIIGDGCRGHPDRRAERHYPTARFIRPSAFSAR